MSKQNPADFCRRAYADAKSLRTLEARHTEATKRSEIDKYNFGFNVDSRFQVLQVNLGLHAYTGKYGSSSCYTFGSMQSDSADLKHAMTAWANKNRDLILNGIADELVALADTEMEAAEAQLAALTKQLREAKEAAK